MLDTILTLTLLASTTFTVLLLCAPSRYIRHSPPRSTGSSEDASTHEPKVSVQVLVLGDIGRSPRMQYHAMSIAKHGGRVDVVGYAGSVRFFVRLNTANCFLESAPHPSLVSNPLISVVPLSPPPDILRTLQAKGIPFIVLGPIKVIWQIWTLFQVLGYRTRPARWLLVQVGLTS
jgi:beta-1,4-mannosyltransferase